MILRKGAVSAKEGERQLIPINMRDGILLCVGKGNEYWNCSAPDGAGRLMRRADAKQSFTVSEFKKQMAEVYKMCIRDSLFSRLKDRFSVNRQPSSAVEPLQRFMHERPRHQQRDVYKRQGEILFQHIRSPRLPIGKLFFQLIHEDIINHGGLHILCPTQAFQKRNFIGFTQNSIMKTVISGILFGCCQA